jgi:chromosomal replication initiator protein
LLHAIGHEIFKQNPSAKIIYTSCETFVNEFIEAIQNKTPSPETFRNKYRKLNCLLLDDIQFLVEKEKSEEEFFYTFNALFESQNQVVVTSDRPEKELQLSERLKSRLRSGMSADIKPPDLETRIAILRKKREIYKISMPDDIIVYIAERVKTSIRELEGCLIRVDGFCNSMKVQPTIDIVKDVIKDYITSEETSKINIDTIQTVVANHFHLDIKELRSQKRTENIAYARQVAMYLACKLTDMSLPSIGEVFDKDHTTVIYARDKISQILHTDPYFNGEMNKLISKIKSISSL